MKRMIIKAIIRLNFKISLNTIAKTIIRIQKNLKDKREKRAKLRKTSAALKRIWLKRKLRKNDVTFIQSYTISSWVNSSRITIDNDNKTATRRHDVDQTNSKWKSYLYKSERDDEVIAIVVRINWECVKRLRDVEIALVHHDEIKELIMTMKRLIEQCAIENECKNKVYKVYSNNQISFKTIRSMKSSND